tara:strand:+ start:48055 stop:48495 length:441 start_codon:yes stop_codon:yes gene_type:complete
MLSSAVLTAQTSLPAKSDFKLSKEVVKKGDEVTLIFTMKLSNTWKVYSNIQNYDMGPLPASFSFEPHPSYELLGRVMPVGSKKEYEPVFEVDVNYFGKRAEFRQRIQVCSDTLLVKGTFQYQLCNALDGRCTYITEEFEFNTATKN